MSSLSFLQHPWESHVTSGNLMRKTTAIGPQSGISLLELLTALSIFTVILLSVGLTLANGFNHRHEAHLRYRAMSALRDVVADIEETANKPTDLVLGIGIGSIWTKYDTQVIAVPSLPGATVTVTCFPDETLVPTDLGGPQDLNFDGDALDNLTGKTASTDLKVVPMSLTLDYTTGSFTESLTIHRLITRTQGEAAVEAESLGEIASLFKDLSDTNDGTPRGDKADLVYYSLQDALDNIALMPPDPSAATSAIDQALVDLQAMIDASLIDPNEGTHFMGRLQEIRGTL